MSSSKHAQINDTNETVEDLDCLKMLEGCPAQGKVQGGQREHERLQGGPRCSLCELTHHELRYTPLACKCLFFVLSSSSGLYINTSN